MKHQSVHSLFSQIASELPANIAITAGPREVSYRELEERSNSLANFLLANGASAGGAVAVLTDDRVEILMAVLGILKAGCVFAPLDPNIPDKRLEAMISLLAPEWFITESRFLHRVNNRLQQTGRKARAICVDNETDTCCLDHLTVLADYHGYFNPEKPRVESQPDDMCYIYFTSGSTGQPKAIAGRLKGIDHFIRWEIKTLGLGADSRVSQILPPSFDGSLRDIFIPLCTGGTACAPDNHDTLLDTEKLIAWLESERISVIHCVPSLFRSLLNEKLTAGNFKSLKYILMAGEPLLPADVKRWTDIFGERIQLINLYGTSETTMAKFAYFVKPSDQKRRSIPVGKPIEGAAAMVLDKRRRLCSRGTIGEIYIRTPYRTLGYYNQPELTAESFIQNPFSNDPNDIVYKTGDLGRILDDGNFEYLGRLDRQVKIRGNRVELPEIENVLRDHAAVVDVAVIDREDSSSHNFLCAYVVLDSEIDTEELRQLVLDQLPDYMVPSAFIVLESLPRTISGKIDRQALPAPGLTRSGMGEYVAPSTHVEKVVAGIWTEVLGIEQNGIHDNFFRLGGHSLRATQILSRVRAALNVEVPLRSLFETPTVAGLAALISTKISSTTPQPEPIEPLSRPNLLPLSFAQQRLWFIDQLEPGNAAYNLPLAVRLNGRLDVQALERTLSEIVRRHEALRTTFSVVDNTPIQVISAPSAVNLTRLDLSTLSEPERETEVRLLAKHEYQSPFDLSRGPLLRAVLIRLSEQEHIALLTMHHIISDGWSQGVLVHEVAALYDAYARGEQSPLAELPIQYADFALWQREWLRGAVLEEGLSYWREQLAGSRSVLELPTDRPRSARQSYRGARVTFAVNGELTEKLRELSQREGVTLFMTLLSGWQTLLARYSGQWDVSVGTPIANRTRGEVEGLIGFFVNTLVLRTRLKAEASFREQLAQVREVCLGAYAHQDVPFEMVVEELQPERDMSRSPLFQVMFVLQNAPLGELRLAGLKLEPLVGEQETTKFDLTLTAMETEAGLVGWCEYRTELFEETTIARLLEHWRVLLEGAVADAGQSLSALPLLPEAERQQVLVNWNDTSVEYPRERTIHDLFTEQAARTPAAVAVEHEGVSLSYAELNARSNQLAHYLRRLGVGPEVRVGSCMERSLELVVGWLGILKAGGAYVPLDREYPLERLRFMIDDAQLRLVLTNGQAPAALAAETSVQLIDLSATTEQISRESQAELESGATADNLVYVLYTSGSTGIPKGVEVPHRAVLRLVLNTDYMPLLPSDRVAQGANPAFDASTFEVWGVLLNGSTSVVLDKEVMLAGEGFGAALKARRISVVFLTPALFHQLAQIDAGVFEPLRAVLVGGDVVDLRWVREVMRRGAPERLLNCYGPTEVTTFSTWKMMTEVATDAVKVPIGRPIANTEAYVLDEWLGLAPVGVNGELYLGGDGLARDYLNCPELTAERFVPHPYARRAGERLYRTGDVVRYLASGEIDFVGRRDAQVKVRGHRIELGEIETVLSQHAGVRDVVAVIREPQPGNKQLVAYVVGEAAVSELRPYLKEKLPAYMAPQVIVKLASLPLTVNGKIDRRALPAPERAGEEAKEGYVAPRTPTEELLTSIWAEVLEFDRVGVHDNFFELGGHSLLATRVTSRIRTVFKLELPLRNLFEHPTIAELAQEITMMVSAVSGHHSVPAMVRVSREGPLPLSFAQQGLWLTDRFDLGNTAYNVPLAVRLSGSLNVEVLRRTLTEVVRRHEVLRTNLVEIDGEPRQIIAPPPEVSLPLVNLCGLGVEEQEAALRYHLDKAAEQRFSLSCGPLMAAEMLKMAEDEHVLILTMHHIVTDGWSMGVLVNEVGALYEAFAAGRESPLAELPIQYADYAVWQREWLQGEVLEELLDYWRVQLAGAPAVEVPTDYSRTAQQSFRSASLAFELTPELTTALNELARREGVTLFMVLLACWQLLLARYTGQEDIVVGSPIANRTQAGVEGLIGLFVNILVLRTNVSDELTFLELLGRVREVCLEAYAHQDLPFERLVEELQPERQLSRAPLLQVLFQLQNAPQQELKLAGLKLSALPIELGITKVDLTLSMAQSEEALFGEFFYNQDLFGETILRMERQWRVLLESIVENPELPISALAMDTEQEDAELIVSFNEELEV